MASKMENSKLDKIINIIREEMMGAAGAGAPTNNIGSGAIAGSVEAGDDPPVFPKKKRKPTPVGRYGTRRTWRQQSGKS